MAAVVCFSVTSRMWHQSVCYCKSNECIMLDILAEHFILKSYFHEKGNYLVIYMKIEVVFFCQVPSKGPSLVCRTAVSLFKIYCMCVVFDYTYIYLTCLENMGRNPYWCATPWCQNHSSSGVYYYYSAQKVFLYMFFAPQCIYEKKRHVSEHSLRKSAHIQHHVKVSWVEIPLPDRTKCKSLF